MMMQPKVAAGPQASRGGGFFKKAGDRYIPTGLGRSPWTGDTQSGVALAALIAFILDRTSSLRTMLMARLTIDIFGAVPMVPLVPVVQIIKEGKRVQLVEVSLHEGERRWACARALRVRVAEAPASPPLPALVFPTTAERFQDMWMERIGPDLDGSTHGPRWIRFLSDAVEGALPSALERVAMIADFGAGVAAPLPRSDWTLANVDISLQLTPEPHGEWLVIDSQSQTEGNGVGIISNRFGDTNGWLGWGQQTIFLDKWRER